MNFADHPDYAIVKHQSGDMYLVQQGSGTGGFRAYGPLHPSSLPTTVEQAQYILSTQPSGALDDDGAWLFDELDSGRAQVVEEKFSHDAR
jgi:hypothetical protein